VSDSDELNTISSLILPISPVLRAIVLVPAVALHGLADAVPTEGVPPFIYILGWTDPVSNVTDANVVDDVVIVAVTPAPPPPDLL
jgi:hypothetical protein